MKRLLVIGGILVGIVIACAAVLSFVIDPNHFRPILESELSGALARPVRLGDLKLALWKGSITANDLSIADDPAYSKGAFIKAKSLGITVEVWPLLTSRKLHVTGLTIAQPVITLIQAQSGEWNFSSLGGKEKQSPKPVASESRGQSDLDLSVKLVRITGGEFSIGSTLRQSRPLVLRDVSIEVRDFAAASQFPYTLRADVAGGGRITLDGTAGPLNFTDTAASPMTASLNITGLDLAATGIAQHAPALAGILKIEGNLRSDGKEARVEGKLVAEKLKLAREGTPAKKPVEFDFALDHALRRHAGVLRKGAIHIGAAPSSLTGTYVQTGETTTLHMTFDGPKMAVNELRELLPAMAVVLPRGSSLEGGTASARITFDGPVDRLVTAGVISIDNTKLANFDLGRKLAFAEALAGIQTSSDTEIQTLGASVHYDSEGGRIQDLEFVVPSIGNLEGAGTVSPANDLAFQMRATVKTVAVPFFIQGTASNPAFRPDVKGIAKDEVNRALGSEKVKGLLKGILGK